MPTVEKKYTADVREGRKDFEGNHDVYEMPEAQKPRGIRWVRTNPRAIFTILLLAIFIVVLVTVIVEIMKRSQGFG